MTTKKTMVGGDHYLKMKIQPRELAMANHWDADAFSALKYLSRFQHKDGVEGLKKARHFAEMRRDWKPEALAIPPKIRMTDYIRDNGFADNLPLKYALLALWDTVYVFDGVRIYSDHLIKKIDELIDATEKA